MISELRLAQIVAVITELSEQKKQDFYRFLLEIKNKIDTIPDESALTDINNQLKDIFATLGKKVDKEQGKGLSSNDFTNELRTKLVNLVGNVQANWNTTNQEDPSYIANKPNIPTSQDINDAIQNVLSGLSFGNEQIQSDWNQLDNTKKDYIKNKPSIPSITGLEQTSNKVVSISNSSTDDEYPSAKCVYTLIGNIESTLNAILGI